MSANRGPGDERLEILAVEDSPTQAELLRYLLEQSGYRVTVASTGAQTLALLGEHAPSLIISDIIMPEMSGYELCRRIRANERTRDIPVILLTSLASSEDVLEGLACGADSFISKPYSKHYLITNIQQVLANRQPGKGELPRINVEVNVAGKTHSVAADRQRIITLLLSTYEAAAHQNAELHETQEELRTVNERLEEKVRERTAALEADITERKRTELELRESEERHRLVLDNAGETIVVLQNWKVAFANPSASKMIGYAREGLLGRPFLESLHPDDQPTVADRHRRRIAGENIQGLHVFRMVRRDGETRDIESSGVPMTWKGEPAVLYFLVDITERKRADEALRASKALLQAAIDILPVGLWIIDAEGKLVTSNAAVQRIWAGVRYVGIDQLGEYKGWRTDSGKLIEAHEWAGARALERGETTIEQEVEIECFDGTRKIILDSAVPLRKSDGGIGGAVTINQDITERKRAEERDRQHLKDTAMLRDTAIGFIQLARDADVYQYVADRLSALVGEAYVVVNSHDEATDEFTVRAVAGIGARLGTVLKVTGRNPVGTVFTVAKEHRTEYASEKLMKFEDGLRGLSYGKLPKVLAQTIEKTFDIGGVYAMGLFWQGRVLGTLNLIMRRGADVRDPAAVEAFVNQAAIALQRKLDADELDRHRIHLEELVAERTRELTAAQGQLVQQEKLAMVGRVAGSVAHELRNPLGAIRNASCFLQMTVAPKLEGKPLQHLRVIDVCVERANKAITMILDFTQGRTTEPVPCALHSILQQAVAEASLPDSVEVCIAIPPGLPQILVDPGQTTVVFRNLLTNAAHAMPSGGTVKIQARAGQDEVVVDVADTGTGVKPEHMANLFKPLFTTGEIGVGLGLAICRGFIEANKGTISVVSELGKGTTFTVTLPAMDEDKS